MAKLEDVILRDTRASQPLASDVAVGTLFYVTDELVTERSNGVTWDDFSDAGGGGGGDVATDTIWNALGDLAAGTGANTAAVLTVGTDGQVLTADSGEATGLIWTTIAGGGDALVANTLDQFADVTQTAGKTLAITENTTLAGGSHSGTNTGDQTSVSGNAGTVTVADAGGDTTTWPLLGTAQTGSLAPATDAGLTYDAATNTLTSGTFVGALTGNVTGNASGSSGSCTGNAATASTATTVSDAAITLAKMANLAQDQFIGRTTASTGVPETATITAAARTVLDDTTVGAMVDTLGGASATGTGGIVRATSPTLVTPLLGTPTSGTLTNCTGLPEAGLSTTDITTGDVSTSKHGFMAKLPNDAAKFIDGTGAWSKFSAARRGRPFYFNEFGTRPSTVQPYPWQGIAIASGTTADLTGIANHPGILSVLASASANSGLYMVWGNGTPCMLITGGEYTEFIVNFQTLTNTTAYFGFHDALAVTAPTDGVWIDVAGTTLSGKCKNNAGPTTTSTTYTITTSVWYRMMIEVNAAASSVTFTLVTCSDGATVWTDTAAGNIPTATGRELGHGFVLTNNTQSGTPTIAYVDYMAVGFDTTALVR